MKIGEALKEERIKLGMSKYQFSKGIVDRKFYGKVENEDGNLSSKKLLLLLQKNNIDFGNFFKKLQSKEKLTVESLDKRMREAFNKRDLKECQKICQRILKLKDEKVLKLRAIVATYYLEDKLHCLTSSFREEIVGEIYRSKNITQNTSIIQLFSNVMPILSEEQLNILILDFLRKFEKLDEKTEIDKKRIAVLLNNYLVTCYEKGMKSTVVDKSMDYLMKMQDVHLLIYKEVGKFYFELIKGNKDQARKIKEELITWNYKKLAENLKV